jgi:hypothetical protein
MYPIRQHGTWSQVIWAIIERVIAIIFTDSKGMVKKVIEDFKDFILSLLYQY